MKPEKVVFVDESLEKSFNELNEADPIRKSLVRAIKNLTRRCFFWKKCEEKSYSKITYSKIWDKQPLDLQSS